MVTLIWIMARLISSRTNLVRKNVVVNSIYLKVKLEFVEKLLV